MSTTFRASVRSAAAVLALVALFAYGPSPPAQAEPASPEEARTIAKVEAKDNNINAPAPSGPTEENASGGKDDPDEEGASKGEKSFREGSPQGEAGAL
ncbi:MAG: hypothetical protein M3P37_11720 [Actinomycetota bacterium]|nr:hypothetical protein [Actinomycetota bacterium]